MHTQAVYLHAKPNFDGWQFRQLACSINRLLTNVGPHTPTDIYLFVNDGHVTRAQEELKVCDAQNT